MKNTRKVLGLALMAARAAYLFRDEINAKFQDKPVKDEPETANEHEDIYPWNKEED